MASLMIVPTKTSQSLFRFGSLHRKAGKAVTDPPLKPKCGGCKVHCQSTLKNGQNRMKVHDVRVLHFYEGTSASNHSKAEWPNSYVMVCQVFLVDGSRILTVHRRVLAFVTVHRWVLAFSPVIEGFSHSLTGHLHALTGHRDQKIPKLSIGHSML
jgi:hypothetical protein